MRVEIGSENGIWSVRTDSQCQVVFKVKAATAIQRSVAADKRGSSSEDVR